MNSRRWTLGVILLLGTGLRLPSLLHAGLWRDEAYLYVELSAPSFAQFFHRFSITEYFPPLYFVLMYAWTAVAGFSEVALKLPSFIFSVLTIAAVYRLARIAAGWVTGLIAAFLFAIMPVAIVYAGDARSYSLLALLIALLAAAYIQLLETPSRGRFLQTSLLALLVVSTHYLGLIALTVLAVLGFTVRTRLRNVLWALLALLIGAAPFVFWVPVLQGQLALGLPWKAPATPSERAANLLMFLLHSVPAESWWAGLALAAAATAAFLSGSFRSKVAYLGAAFLCIIALIAGLGLTDLRYVYPFYGLIAVFEAWAIVGAYSAIRAKNLIWRSVGAAAGSLVAIFTLALGVTSAIAAATPHSGIRTLVAADPPTPRSAYVVAPDYIAATFFYYTRERKPAYIGFVRENNAEFFRAAGYARDWNDPFALQRTECSIAALSRVHPTLIYVVDKRAHNQWHVPYARVWNLLAFLKTHYALNAVHAFAGSNESVLEYRFIVSPREGGRYCPHGPESQRK